VYRAHIAPVVGAKHPRDWTVEDCEAVRDALDAKVAAGSWKREERVYRFGWKRAWNVWALFTSACKAACRSKNKALRVRRDNPCAGVETPDRGMSKQKQWLYPDEFIKLVSDEALPLRWVRLYTHPRLQSLELRQKRGEAVPEVCSRGSFRPDRGRTAPPVGKSQGRD
jgi:hypothetical protein